MHYFLFQATLNMHLLENVPLRTKNMVVFYLLCEFLAMAPEEKQPEVRIINSPLKYLFLIKKLRSLSLK